MKRELLIAKREDHKLSRLKLAQLLEVSESMIEKVESGTRRASPDLAERWAVVLGIKQHEWWEFFFNNQQDNMSAEMNQQAATRSA